MSPGIIFWRAPFFNGEKLWSVASIEFLEAIHRHARSARDKLQETRTHLVIEGQNDTPEPLHSNVICMVVALVQCVLLPILDVDVLDSAHKQFQFVLVEDLDQR